MQWNKLSLSTKGGLTGCVIGVLLVSLLVFRIEGYDEVFRLLAMPTWIGLFALSIAGMLTSGNEEMLAFILTGATYYLIGFVIGFVIDQCKNMKARKWLCIMSIFAVPIIVVVLIWMEQAKPY